MWKCERRWEEPFLFLTLLALFAPLALLGLVGLLNGVPSLLELVEVQLFTQHRHLFRLDVADNIDEYGGLFAVLYEDHDALDSVFISGLEINTHILFIFLSGYNVFPSLGGQFLADFLSALL